jgi:hypothetical protein
MSQAAPSFNLADYICFGTPPAGKLPVMSVTLRTGGDTIHLMVHPSRWPKKLLEEHYLDLLYTFGELFRRPAKVESQIVLCAQAKCNRKSGEREHRGCPYFSAGVCTAATQKHSPGMEHSYAMIAAIHGKTKSAHQENAEDARQDLIARIRQNPVLIEILSELYNTGNSGKG